MKQGEEETGTFSHRQTKSEPVVSNSNHSVQSEDASKGRRPYTMNSVFLLGNIAGEIRLTETPGGTPKASFKLAVSNRPDSDGKPRDPDYIWIKTWNGTATAVKKHLGVGSEILVQNGQIKTRSVKREDGGYDNYFEVNAPSIKFLRRPNGSGSNVEEEVEVSTDAPAPSEDEIPF